MASNKSQLVYSSIPGGIVSKRHAQAVGEELERLRHNGIVRTPDVVQAARNPKSSMYRYFPWNVKRAAAEHWANIARRIIGSIYVVEIVQDTPETLKRRYYHSVYISREAPERGYADLESVAGNRHYRNQIIEMALRQLEAWHARWGTYQELFGAAGTIAKVIKRLARYRRPPNGHGKPGKNGQPH